MEETEVVNALSALAQPQRLRIFRALVGAGPAGLTPGALGAVLDMPGSTLSFHLKELAHAGLVAPQRDGRHLIYRPQIRQMTDLMDYLTAHCCEGAADPGGCLPASPGSRMGC